jgi:hypothetical protein
MSLFYFSLNTGPRLVADREGTPLPSIDAARSYAAAVARDIMRNDRHRTLSWRICVSDSEHRPCFEVLFASVADDLMRFSPAVQETLTRTAHSVASLNDDIKAVRESLLRLRATLARADQMPYLAALNGARIDPAA